MNTEAKAPMVIGDLLQKGAVHFFDGDNDSAPIRLEMHTSWKKSLGR